MTPRKVAGLSFVASVRSRGGFSVNKTRQEFHRNNPNRVEVYDSESDIVLYDVLQKRYW